MLRLLLTLVPLLALAGCGDDAGTHTTAADETTTTATSGADSQENAPPASIAAPPAEGATSGTPATGTPTSP